MYHPYFRGKQFELITIREMAPLLAQSGFVPIIEPVKESLSGLKKALKKICDSGGKAIVIVNPHHGDHGEGGVGISQFLQEDYLGNDAIAAGILLRSDTTLAEAAACYAKHQDHSPTIIHAGFTEPKALADHLGDAIKTLQHVFVETHSKAHYHKHFEGASRILVRDGFIARLRNADYPQLDEFSDLHVTHGELGMAGFGDFLTVGDSYAEGGGPAYAVAIHLTFIDAEKDDVMYVHHFVSEDKHTPTDPAGKFAQALNKLIVKLDSGKSKLLETNAIKEYRELHATGHFPGLGYVKKLSMKHHIQTLAGYLGSHGNANKSF